MVGKWKTICLCLLAFWCLCLDGQEYRANISLLYGVPAYGSFFQDGYESRIGVRLRGVYHRTDKLVIGGTLETLKFVPYIDNPIAISQAQFYSAAFHIGYDISGIGSNRLEPFAETGYYLFRYNDGAFTGQSFGLSLGGKYIYYVEDNYGLSVGAKWTSVFDKFGRAYNPNEVSHLQVILLHLGLVFDF